MTKLTIEEFNAALEDAFNAGRLQHPKAGYMYGTFGEYYKSLYKHEVKLPQSSVIKSVCVCERPDPYTLMPDKCFRCHGRIEVKQTVL